jgi:hypothetical protein
MNTQSINTANQNNAGQKDKSSVHQDQPRQSGTEDQQQSSAASRSPSPAKIMRAI